jgi:hypothetical protein
MRKVFYNKLPETSDFQKKEEQVKTCWAVFSRDTDGCIDVDDWHFAKLQKIAKDVAPFKEGSLMGWKLKDGTLVVPAWFDTIELCKYFLYLHHGDRYTTVSQGQLCPGRQDEDREYYVENGLLGLRDPKTDEHLTPAAYDYIYQWGEDSDVIYTVRDGVPKYFNHKGEPILTEWRKFPDVTDDDEPYFRSERQHMPYLILTEPVAKPIDNQCCWSYKRWVRLDRIHKSEVKTIMHEHCEIQLVPDNACDGFYSPDAYIYSAYCVRSKENNPIRDCFRQLSELGCYISTWSYLTKIWVSPHTTVPLEELRKVWRVFAIQREHVFPFDLRNIGIGYDETLAEDEVKMFQVIFYAERPPLMEECDYKEALRNGTLEDFKKKRIALGQRIREIFQNDRYDQEVKDWIWKDLWSIRHIPGNASSQLSWDETKEKYDYLFHHGYSMRGALWSVCAVIFDKFEPSSWFPAQGMCFEDLEWCCIKVKWLIDHSAEVNYICKNMTALDYLGGALYYARKQPNEIQSLLERMYDMIEEHGGKCIYTMYAEGRDPLTELYCKF